MQLRRRTALALLLLAACGAPPQAELQALPVDAEGSWIRHRRVRLAPAHTKGFEAVLATCVEAAEARDWAGAWLCYRESPGRYWIVTFAGEGGSFLEPAGLKGFVGTLSPTALEELGALEHEVEWEWEGQQAEAWSTGDEVDLTTHPKARLMVRTVRSGMEAEFAEAVAGRTRFLRESGYPLPIEGFVSRGGGPPRSQLQVVFPTDWATFHGEGSFGLFVKSLDEPTQAAYAARKAALMRTMSRAEFHDADLVPELCFGI